MKRCPKCGETLPRSAFWKNRTTKDGLQSYCKACLTLLQRGQVEPWSWCPICARYVRGRVDHLVETHGWAPPSEEAA